jgi:hypothetical protein
VKKFIPAELSYSCRFWGAHVRAVPFDSSLAEEIKAFLDKEHLLFWLEVLSLLKGLSSSVGILSYIVDWFKVCCSTSFLVRKFLWIGGSS